MTHSDRKSCEMQHSSAALEAPRLPRNCVCLWMTNSSIAHHANATPEWPIRPARPLFAVNAPRTSALRRTAGYVPIRPPDRYLYPSGLRSCRGGDTYEGTRRRPSKYRSALRRDRQSVRAHCQRLWNLTRQLRPRVPELWAFAGDRAKAVSFVKQSQLPQWNAIEVRCSTLRFN